MSLSAPPQYADLFELGITKNAKISRRLRAMIFLQEQ
jgi:hypothetical protein